MDKLIITKDDIKLARPTAELDPSRIEPYIHEAQEYDLQPVLNDALYFDLLSKFDNANPMYTAYQELINGKQYTLNGNPVYYKGLKYMVAYFALSRYILVGDNHYARYGVVKKTLSQSESVSLEEREAESRVLKSNATSESLKLKCFLENNKDTYTLYEAMAKTATRTTGLNFFGFGTNPNVRR